MRTLNNKGSIFIYSGTKVNSSLLREIEDKTHKSSLPASTSEVGVNVHRELKESEASILVIAD
jgi:hypothetical protein